MKTIYHKSSNNRIKGLSAVLLASLMALNFGCTKNFEDFNTNPNSLSSEQSEALLKSAIGPIEQEIFHNYQIAQNLSADAFSGYMMAPNPFGGINNMNYSLNNGWNSAGFNDQYNYVMAPISKIGQSVVKTKSPEAWGISLLVQVMAMSRVTDKFGPIPYTTAGSSLVSTPYESQKAVYNAFFKHIDTAANNLQAYISANPGKTSFFGVGDLVYAGDPVKWLKLANSLRLRLALRIVKADPTTAKLQGEKALSAPGGLLSTVADNAAVAQSGTRDNDLWVVTVAYDGDNGLGAALQTYLVGYNDPRLPVYATPAKDPLFAGQYIGIRSGANTTFSGLGKPGYKTYSSLNSTDPAKSVIGQKAPQILMTAAEVWFLKAEAALRGWTGSGDAQTNYETGITTSFQQWNVSAGSYLADATNTQTAYTDPKNPANNAAAVSTITIKWDPTATNEQNLERIITQKWLAIFPDGQEAWSEYRRTGYPKLFTVANNNSGGTINTQTQIRRLPYPSTEYGNGNKDEIPKAIVLLGGPDNGGTRLWWDVNKANF
ncbi:SusD/RagB family nutrient-binding outer membrane lipoprotein [Pedobacter miscanthi]|uniref:SusD/RagB family nutrient-binding outer membrane lipoprotein n=1 Tax=Pedobacter miscanthi TaxID=2259170 RepID=A0A366KN85_9SPHI|nr:SusD/RagB family nutrient-binding outer membrane lipoprotein [Pedobacter miscanthi]RBQ02743.1 SusD/RagB family nutrient-binding outer membrane lipoprotein [Pedobacter miscanthi]